LILAFVVFNPGDLYYLGYKKIIKIIINISVEHHKVITTEVLESGSVLLGKGKRGSPGEEECL